MKEEARFARDIAASTCEVVAKLQGEVAVRDKGGGLGPVTEADIEADRLVVAALAERFPDDTILSEESSHDIDLGAKRIWCVDPIDGTREYAKGLHEYAVMIGLLVDRVPVAGAVAIPTGQTFWGWVGGGVFLRSRPVHVPPRDALEDAMAIHSRSHSEGVGKALRKLRIPQSVRAGSVGYKVAQLLLGNAHVYIHTSGGTSWWDSVGPAALMLAAGGHVGNARGRPLTYEDNLIHDDGLLMTVPGLGRAAAQRLRSK